MSKSLDPTLHPTPPSYFPADLSIYYLKTTLPLFSSWSFLHDTHETEAHNNKGILSKIQEVRKQWYIRKPSNQNKKSKTLLVLFCLYILAKDRWRDAHIAQVGTTDLNSGEF
jgi:hypothetical protein